MSVRTNIEIFVGEDLDLEATITEDGTATGDPVNITGWTITFALRVPTGPSWLGSTEPPALFTQAAVIVSGSGGTLTVDIDSADTADLTAGEYLYEIARTDSGFNRVLCEGTATLKDRANRP